MNKLTNLHDACWMAKEAVGVVKWLEMPYEKRSNLVVLAQQIVADDIMQFTWLPQKNIDAIEFASLDCVSSVPAPDEISSPPSKQLLAVVIRISGLCRLHNYHIS